jgi:hypothetical protein
MERQNPLIQSEKELIQAEIRKKRLLLAEQEAAEKLIQS